MPRPSRKTTKAISIKSLLKTIIKRTPFKKDRELKNPTFDSNISNKGIIQESPPGGRLDKRILAK